MADRTQRLLLAALLAAAVLVVYVPAYRADFIDFDDSDYVTGNPHVASGLSATNVHWAFTRYHSSNWHPLTWISHMLDVELFRLDPRGHHAVNVALHAVNAALLFLMLASLTGQKWPSLIVAALFALHPVNVESVAWISQRKTTLSTLFGILAIWSYGLYAKGRSRQYYASLAWFACSLMAKQTLVTLPFALLLIDFWPLRRPQLEPPRKQALTWPMVARGWWKLVPEKLPYLAITVAAAAITLLVQHQAINTLESMPVSVRLGNASISYVRYLGLLIWPLKLAVFYPLYNAEVTLPRVVASLAALAAISAAVCYLGLRWRYLFSGWFWYLGTMVPVIGLVQVGAQSMADRYAYVSFWGLFIAIVWGTRDLLGTALAFKSVRTATAAVTIAVLAGLSWLSVEQASQWRDTITLFEDAAADTELNWQAHRVLADHYLIKADYRRAIEHCRLGVECGKEQGRILSTYGRALFEQGDADSGLAKMQQAAKVDPENALVRTNLGWALGQTGRFEAAAKELSAAAKRLDDRSTSYARRMVYVNWAHALAKTNRLSDARQKLELALAEEPLDALLLLSAADLDLQLNDPRRAIERLRQALSREPNNAQSNYLLAKALAADGQLETAISQFDRVSRQHPDQLDPTLQSVRLLARMGREAEARERLMATLAYWQHSPNPQANQAVSLLYTHLANLDVGQKRPADAIEHYNQALAAWPENYQANNNLAWLLATCREPSLRDGKRAVALATRASELLGRPHAGTLGTLAAAYAANGDFAKATATARDALAEADKTGDEISADACRRQLALYEKGQPYIED